MILTPEDICKAVGARAVIIYRAMLAASPQEQQP